MQGDEKSLRIRIAGSSSAWLIDGNPHTHQGRMRAVDPDTGESTYFSLSEVTDATDLARAWIAGFLREASLRPLRCSVSGSLMPRMTTLGGIAGDPPSPTTAERATGLTNHGRTCCPFRTASPFLHTSGRFEAMRSGNGSAASWVLADPQPSRPSGCSWERSATSSALHSMVVTSTAHLICEVCGLVDFILPEGMTEEEFERLRFSYEPKLIADD